jgi:hypothetical protein
MVIQGEVLVVGGARRSCAAQFSGPGPPSNKGSRGDRMRLWANRRKSRDDEKPRHGSGRRGSYRAGTAAQVDGCVVRVL